MIRAPLALILALSVAGCGPAVPRAAEQPSAGAALERAAIAAGVVADPGEVDPVGAFASETDRVCIVPLADGFRIGAGVDHGDRQGCVARGRATGRETLWLDLGSGCQFEARFDGARIVFPAALPAACDRQCTGRATLGALNAARLSSGETEARAMRGPHGDRLCD
jgi:hypothetical protein